MLTSFKLRKKIFAISSLISLTLNILQPAFIAMAMAPVLSPTYAVAQEVPVVDPAPVVESTISTSTEPSVAPSVVPTVAPSVEPSVLPSATPEIIVTPTPVPSVLPSVDPSSSPDSTVVPSDLPLASVVPSADSSPAPPSPLSSPVMTDQNEQLQIVVVDNTVATSISEIDLTVTETGSAILATDKLDYAPTDTALITGAGFLPNTSYLLTISSTDDPSTSKTESVTTDEEGKLFYAYQLDGVYRPNYKVEAYLIGTVIATVTFTDSDDHHHDDDDKITICHKNQGNGWTQNTVSDSAIDGSGSGDHNQSGHQNGGDIIPPNYDDDTVGYWNSRNWNTRGQSILENGCKAESDLIVTKTHTPSGSVNLGSTFTWKLRVANIGQEDAEFDENETIITDNLPSTSLTYGSLTYNYSDVGNFSDIACQIVSNTLTCRVKNNEHAEIREGGYLEILIPVTFSASGTYVNPKSGGICKVDPSNKVDEKNDSNNSCSDTVVINPANGRIDGIKFNDLDGDGIRDNTESLLSGWKFDLKNSLGAKIKEATSTINGFTFSDVPFGSYTICEQPQTGWVQTSPADNACVAISLTSEGQSASVNFGNIQMGKIIIEKQTLPDKETDSFGFTASYYKDVFSLSDGMTNDSGFLMPGTYSVSETDQSGWTLTDTTCSDNSIYSEISLQPGETVTCIFTNTKLGSISGFKWEDLDGDGYWDEEEDAASGWVISLLNSDKEIDTTTTDIFGAYSFTSLLPGTYSLLESLVSGWMQTSSPSEVVLSAGQESKDNNFGNFELGRISGFKYKDINGNGNWDKGEYGISNWEICLITDNVDSRKILDEKNCVRTNSDGYYEFAGLEHGDYAVTEDESDLNYERTEPETGSYEITIDSGTGYGEYASYDFGNAPLIDIHGYKWNDINGNGERDCHYDGDTENKVCEDLLGDWTIFLDANKNGILDGEEQSIDTVSDKESDHFGWYWFNDLFPGNYTICELPKEGWNQTYPKMENYNKDSEEGFVSLCHSVDLPNDDRQTENSVFGPEYNFGNQERPNLTIKKSNDATGSKNGGDLVGYKLTLHLENSDLTNINVTDVTPEGFEYVAGSWSATLNGLPFTLLEPDYGSPGTWHIDSLEVGDTLELSYYAKIQDGVDAGTYQDTAWASGESESFGNSILAKGIESPFYDGIFVGTTVAVNKNYQQTGNVAIERQSGEVLGVSTEMLPATGVDTGWLYLALGSLLTGLLFIFGGKMFKKSLIVIVVLASLFSFAPPTLAADPDNNLSVRIEQPSSPIRINDWKLSYSVLDRAGRTPVVNCYVKKPGSSLFTSFDVAHTSTKSSGDNASCKVDGSVMSAEGEYQFYITATSGENSESSDTVVVKYDTSGPGEPNYYNKEHPSSCKYIIKFHTADDGGATSKVEIYSSDSKTFDTNNGSRVGTVNIGSNEDGTFTHDRADNCDREWYYVIRAFDASGNQSSHRGDQVTISSTSSSTSTLASTQGGSPAIVLTRAAGSILGKQTEGETEQSADTESTLEPASESTGEVLGEEKDLANKNAKYLWILLGVGIVAIIYAISRSKNMAR